MGWLNEFPFSYQNVCLVLLSFVLRGRASHGLSPREGIQPPMQHWPQLSTSLKRSLELENITFSQHRCKRLHIQTTKVLKN